MAQSRRGPRASAALRPAGMAIAAVAMTAGFSTLYALNQTSVYRACVSESADLSLSEPSRILHFEAPTDDELAALEKQLTKNTQRFTQHLTNAHHRSVDALLSVRWPPQGDLPDDQRRISLLQTAHTFERKLSEHAQEASGALLRANGALGGGLLLMVGLIFGLLYIAKQRRLEASRLELSHSEAQADLKRLGEASKQTQRALSSAEAHLQDIGVGTFTWDLTNQRLSFSQSWKHMLGWTADDIGPHAQEWLKRVHRDDIDAVEATIEHVRAGGSDRCLEYRLLHRDGAYRWMRGWLRLIDEQSLIGTQLDITSDRALQEIRDNFISVVSHELRTPLTSIIGSLDLVLGTTIFEPLPDATADMLKLARKNSDRLLRLITDMLDVEKFESGMMRFDVRITPLQPLIEQAIEALRGYASTHAVSIVVRDHIPGAQVAVDPDRLIQALVNLLSNAIKFSPSDGQVKVELKRVQDWLRVSVTDQGPGVSDAFKPHLFEKFAQEESGSTRRHPGTGLGLTITKSIIDHLNGRLGVESEVGRGSTFYFELKEPWL